MVSELAQAICCLFEEHGTCDFVVTRCMLDSAFWSHAMEIHEVRGNFRNTSIQTYFLAVCIFI